MPWSVSQLGARSEYRFTRPAPRSGEESAAAHDEELDTPRRRDELARITNGYSPAMIDQVCSMALTYAHSDGRDYFEWHDLVEAMTTVEAGVAVTINSDDPPMFATTLNHDYAVAADLLDLDEQGVADLARAAVDASFAPADVKTRITAEIEAYAAR